MHLPHTIPARLIGLALLQVAVATTLGQAGGSGNPNGPRIIVKKNVQTFTKGFGSYSYKANGKWSEYKEHYDYQLRYSDQLILGNMTISSSVNGVNVGSGDKTVGSGSSSYKHKHPTLLNPALDHNDSYKGSSTTYTGTNVTSSLKADGNCQYDNPKSAMVKQPGVPLAVEEGVLSGNLKDHITRTTPSETETGDIRKEVRAQGESASWVETYKDGIDTLAPFEWMRPRGIMAAGVGMPNWAVWKKEWIDPDGLGAGGSGKYGSYKKRYTIHSRHQDQTFITACRGELGDYLADEGEWTLSDGEAPFAAGSKSHTSTDLSADNGTVSTGATPIVVLHRKFTPATGEITPGEFPPKLDQVRSTLETGKVKYRLKGDASRSIGGMVLAIETFEKPSDSEPTILKVRSWIPTPAPAAQGPNQPQEGPEWELDLEDPKNKKDGTYKVWVVGVSVQKVSFKGDKYLMLKSDDNATNFDAPHWQDDNANRDTEIAATEGNWSRSYDPDNAASYSSGRPVAYSAGSIPKTDIVVKIPNAPSWLKLKIKARGKVGQTGGPDSVGTGVGETDVPSGGGLQTLSDVSWANAWPAPVACHDWNDKNGAYSLDWKVKVVGDPETDPVASWRSMYKTYHRIYVTAQVPETPLRQESLFHIACEQANGFVGDEAIFNGIWNHLKNKKVRRVQHIRSNTVPRGMTYYGGAANTVGLFSTSDLLRTDDGRCGAWQRMMRDLLFVHKFKSFSVGTVLPRTDFDPLEPGGGLWGFWINNLTYSRVTGTSNTSGLEGQGLDNPGTKAFTNHALVLRGSTVYDPSYGKEYPGGMPEWENASVSVVVHERAGGGRRWFLKGDYPAGTRLTKEPVSWTAPAP